MAKTRTKKSGGESVSGYFRKVFEEQPALLYSKSNQQLRERWLADHPGNTEVPRSVMQNLANLKSLLRKKYGKRRKPAARQEGDETATVSGRRLENLEESIDECLTYAKNLDRSGLENVIKHLRRARNYVILKQGE
jgi:hypothetical protein